MPHSSGDVDDWQIHYADGSVWCEHDGPWEDAPSRGVAVVVTSSDTVGREVESGYDFYLVWPGQVLPWGTDVFGYWDYLIEVGHADARKPLAEIDIASTLGVVKLGRRQSDEEWHPVYQKAIKGDGMRWEKSAQVNPSGNEDYRDTRRHRL